MTNKGCGKEYEDNYTNVIHKCGTYFPFGDILKLCPECDGCGEWYRILFKGNSIIEIRSRDNKVILFKGKVCPECNNNSQEKGASWSKKDSSGTNSSQSDSLIRGKIGFNKTAEDTSLSSKIVYVGQINGECCEVKDVKLAISKLKEVLENSWVLYEEEITKIFGEELTK